MRPSALLWPYLLRPKHFASRLADRSRSQAIDHAPPPPCRSASANRRSAHATPMATALWPLHEDDSAGIRGVRRQVENNRSFGAHIVAFPAVDSTIGAAENDRLIRAARLPVVVWEPDLQRSALREACRRLRVRVIPRQPLQFPAVVGRVFHDFNL